MWLYLVGDKKSSSLGLIQVSFFADIRCFTFADMPWYTKKIAGALFATPPSSTYDEVNIKW